MLAMDCALAGAELHHGRPLNRIVRQMVDSKLTTFLLIHLLTPLLGVTSFLVLLRVMSHAGVARALAVPFFLVHTFYGALLLIVLTSLFWPWSGMASLGTIACLLVGPIVMLGQSLWLRTTRRQSWFHAVAFALSTAYPLCLAGLVMWAALTGVSH